MSREVGYAGAPIANSGASMLPLILSITLVLGAGSLVYAMHTRRELARLGARAQSGWLAVDEMLIRRHDLVNDALDRLSPSDALPEELRRRLERALDTLDRARAAQDLLNLGAAERQLRSLTTQLRTSAGTEVESPLAALRALEQMIVELAETYDGSASLYNIRLRRLPGRLVAELEGLEALPLIEFVEPFGLASAGLVPAHQPEQRECYDRSPSRDASS